MTINDDTFGLEDLIDGGCNDDKRDLEREAYPIKALLAMAVLAISAILLIRNEQKVEKGGEGKKDLGAQIDAIDVQIGAEKDKLKNTLLEKDRAQAKLNKILRMNEQLETLAQKRLSLIDEHEILSHKLWFLDWQMKVPGQALDHEAVQKEAQKLRVRLQEIGDELFRELELEEMRIRGQEGFSVQELARRFGLLEQNVQAQRDIKLLSPWPWFGEENQSRVQEKIPYPIYLQEETRLRKEFADQKEGSPYFDHDFWEDFPEWKKRREAQEEAQVQDK